MIQAFPDDPQEFPKRGLQAESFSCELHDKHHVFKHGNFTLRTVVLLQSFGKLV